MDDLSAAINRVLSDPESLRQLQEAAASLGLTGDGGAAPPPQAPQPRTINRGMPGRRSTYQQGRPPGDGAQSSEQAELSRLLEQLAQGGSQGGAQGQEQYQQPYEPPRDNTPDVDLNALSGVIAGLTGKSSEPPHPHQKGSGPDLSALSGFLGNLTGGQPQQSKSQTPDLSALLAGLGQQPQQRQSQTPDLSALLGNLTGGQPQQSQSQPPDLSALLSGLTGQNQAPTQAQTNANGGQEGGLDLSALSGLLGNLGGGSAGGGGLDLSGLQGILSGLTGGGGASQAASHSTASTLAAMLGGGNDPGPAPGGLDLNMLMRFQQAMSGMTANAGNVKLLMAVKGHLKDEARREKVDDAIRVMQVVQFLPLLKESGIFGKLEEILDGFGMGGIGSMLGSLGGGSGSSGGLGGILGPLTGRR